LGGRAARPASVVVDRGAAAVGICSHRGRFPSAGGEPHLLPAVASTSIASVLVGAGQGRGDRGPAVEGLLWRACYGGPAMEGLLWRARPARPGSGRSPEGSQRSRRASAIQRAHPHFRAARRMSCRGQLVLRLGLRLPRAASWQGPATRSIETVPRRAPLGQLHPPREEKKRCPIRREGKAKSGSVCTVRGRSSVDGCPLRCALRSAVARHDAHAPDFAAGGLRRRKAEAACGRSVRRRELFGKTAPQGEQNLPENLRDPRLREVQDVANLAQG